MEQNTPTLDSIVALIADLESVTQRFIERKSNWWVARQELQSFDADLDPTRWAKTVRSALDGKSPLDGLRLEYDAIACAAVSQVLVEARENDFLEAASRELYDKLREAVKVERACHWNWGSAYLRACLEWQVVTASTLREPLKTLDRGRTQAIWRRRAERIVQERFHQLADEVTSGRYARATQELFFDALACRAPKSASQLYRPSGLAPWQVDRRRLLQPVPFADEADPLLTANIQLVARMAEFARTQAQAIDQAHRVEKDPRRNEHLFEENMLDALHGKDTGQKEGEHFIDELRVKYEAQRQLALVALRKLEVVHHQILTDLTAAVAEYSALKKGAGRNFSESGRFSLTIMNNCLAADQSLRLCNELCAAAADLCRDRIGHEGTDALRRAYLGVCDLYK